MSGGGPKKKPPKGHGWEEAGAEFYQESYPTDGEFDVLQRDPKHLATLLPSKQTRGNQQPDIWWFTEEPVYISFSNHYTIKKYGYKDF